MKKRLLVYHMSIRNYMCILLCAFALTANAQQSASVVGIVRDEANMTLPNVTVTATNINTKLTSGAQTDALGAFKFSSIPEGNYSFTFTSIGFETKTLSGYQLKAGKTTNILLKLASSDNKLDEVVVVGYGTQKKANITSSIATINSKVLESRPLVNLAQGLQGALPGLNIGIGNGAPGAGASFNIRGTASINGTSPLVLVDGVQMDPNLINPADVASVSVLKDAGAAAIYGGRAAFGVILITTKNPSKNSKTQLSFSSSYNLSRQTYLPKYVSSMEYLTMFLAADRTGKNGGNTASEPFTELDSIMAQKYLSNPTPENSVYPSPINPNKYRYVGNTDWLDLLYPGYAPMLDNNISLSGGEGKISYVASLGNLNQKGLLEAANQKFNRYNASLKINAQATSWLDLNFRASLNRTTYNTANTNRFFSDDDALQYAYIPGDLSPLMSVKHPDGNWAGQGNYTNMFALMAQNGRIYSSKNDLWLTGGFVLKPIKDLNIVGDITWNNYRRDNNRQFIAYNEYGLNGKLLGVYPHTTPSRIIKSNNNDAYHAINIYGEYTKTFLEDHNFKLTVGLNDEAKKVDGYSFAVANQLDPTLNSLTPNTDAGAVSAAVSNFAAEWAIRGAFTRFNYDYKGKYIFQFSGRYDGTSRFPVNDRNVFTPSFSLAWRASEEKFLSGIKSFIDDLKFRASYGTLPNQVTDSYYPYIATLPTGTSNYILGDQNGVFVGTPGLVSNTLSWEKITTKNLGVDISALKNRLIINFDIYQRDTKDMITAGMQLPSVLGTAVPSRNSADLRNRGWELNLTWKDKIGEDLNYSVNFNVSDYKAKITKYENNPTGNIGDYYVGRNINEVWGFTTDRYFTSDAEAAAANQSAVWGGKWLAGDIKYVDLDGNGKIDYGNSTLSNPGDRSIIGNTTPHYQFGLNLSFDYKGFDFTTFAQGTMKRDFWLGGSYFWGLTNEYQVPMKNSLDYWTPNNLDAYYPRVRFGGGGNWITQTKYKQNAAYLRLKQLTLGYTFPKRIMDKVNITRLRIFTTAQNLFTIANLSDGFDPELLGAQSYPLSRTFSFGLQFGL